MLAILICGAVSYHTQAPLISLHCPPNERQDDNHSTPEDCASFDILFFRSVSDLWAGTGDFVHRYREDVNAVSTLAIACFTGTLWWTTRKQLRHLDESVRLANAEFASTHRPRVRVRWAVMRKAVEKEHFGIDIRLANVGDAKATIVHSDITLSIFVAGEMAPDRQRFPQPYRTMVLAPGQSSGGYSQFRNAWDTSQLNDPSTTYEIEGVIRYKDSIGIERETAFHRVNIDGPLGRFDRTDPINIGREYED
jgi:hypothetical protein